MCQQHDNQLLMTSNIACGDSSMQCGWWSHRKSTIGCLLPVNIQLASDHEMLHQASPSWSQERTAIDLILEPGQNHLHVDCCSSGDQYSGIRCRLANMQNGMWIKTTSSWRHLHLKKPCLLLYYFAIKDSTQCELLARAATPASQT